MKKRLWLWNILAVLTVIVCLLAFVMHYKNWTKAKDDSIQILSGFYYQELKYSELDSLGWVDRIPPMERLNGFSALEKGKGIFREFKDSLTDKKVYVFVDNYEQPKIKVVHNDSLKMFINLRDSTDTEAIYELLAGKMESPSE
ncbi:MAG: hypothetical protein WA913_06475 [Pricia sp.]